MWLRPKACMVVMKQLGAHSNLLKKTVIYPPLRVSHKWGDVDYTQRFSKGSADNVKVMMDF